VWLRRLCLFSPSVAACKHPHFRPELIANLKLQTHPMKAAIGNHQILRLPIVSQRPGRVIHDRPLYGKQLCDMEFIFVPTAAGR